MNKMLPLLLTDTCSLRLRTPWEQHLCPNEICYDFHRFPLLVALESVLSCVRPHLYPVFPLGNRWWLRALGRGECHGLQSALIWWQMSLWPVVTTEASECSGFVLGVIVKRCFALFPLLFLLVTSPRRYTVFQILLYLNFLKWQLRIFSYGPIDSISLPWLPHSPYTSLAKMSRGLVSVFVYSNLLWGSISTSFRFTCLGWFLIGLVF